jgi:acetylornithine/succinyldiaminopimelate/putrescine aminotransferase
MGALSATGQPKYHAGVQPLLPGFRHAPFGDLNAAEQLIDNETIGILVEPIQGEGGINIPPAGFLEGLRALCDRHGLLLILDEVQSGMGRTGKWYAYQHWGIQPDIITLAKAIAGGIALGGLIAKPEVAEKLVPGTHAATFGGNPIACRAALATIDTIAADGLLEHASELERRFRERFESLQSRCPLIREVRAKGAMIGIELTMPGADVVKRCLERRLLVNCTHQTVIRLLPALNLPDGLFDEGCAILEEAILAQQNQGPAVH